MSENSDPILSALTFYREKLPELLQHEGKFVLVHAHEIAGFYDSYGDALAAGYEKYGFESFLVKRIAAVEETMQFSRPLVFPCLT